MKMKRMTLAFTASIVFASTVSANDADMQAVLKELQALKQRVVQLEAQVQAAEATAKTANTSAIEANEIAEIAVESVERSTASNAGLAGISLGGYGELHYNNLDSGSEIDFHRFVLFVGKEFNENLRFFSELELEHSLAGDGKPGEVELEQAYVEYDFGGNLSTKAGLFLLPIGFLNETHEPPTFHGVERNKIESEIIPSTWWEAGTAITGRYDSGFSYDLALHSGLKVPTEGSNAFRIRSGRQKVAEAVAEDFAVTGRVKYTGIPGLELGLSLQHQSDITQGIEDASATLLETHAAYQRGKFGVRALYAEWDINSDLAASLGKDSQSGFYLEPSYRINDYLSLFARYGEYNTAENADISDIKQTDIGLNWYWSEDVVIKADVQNQSGASDDDGFNLGVGFSF